jgi:transcriptional regulator of aromatic amino acid metabolism
MDRAFMAIECAVPPESIVYHDLFATSAICSQGQTGVVPGANKGFRVRQ